jgi:pyridoxal phosphate enzyme (YggS family)
MNDAARVEENLARIRGRIHDAAKRSGRSADDVILVAVSKMQPQSRLEAAYRAGQRVFGENYVQSLERRKTELPADARWHMIGHVQTNKAKKLAGIEMVESVDSERLARALASVTAGGAPLDVLIEVNIGEEAQKSGVFPSGAEALIEAVRRIGPQLALKGLMCIPPASQGRGGFARLRALAEELRRRSGLLLPHLSMGMSDDFEDAIAEGATIVRVGTSIFGAREIA